MALAGKSVEQIKAFMQERLIKVVPELEIAYKAELVFEIEQLKAKTGATILGHNYMEPALYHTVTDFVGDSLELARKGAATEAPIIVFCGVEFMAETAKILSPEKTVLLPSKKAGCSLASSITAEDVRELKRRYPGVPVVSYVNTYADVKAETDICVTSGNAVKIVNALESEQIIFIPDEFLAKNVARETGKTLIYPTQNPADAKREDELKRELISWRGRCEVHELFTVEDIENVRRQFPDVVVLAHPECSPEVVEAADYSGSTSKMIQYVKDIDAKQYLLLTECSMGDNIVAENPHRDLLRLCSHRCPHMGQITLEQTRDALKFMQYAVEVPKDIIEKARRSLERMLEMS